MYPEPPDPGSVPSCAEGGVLGVICGTVGSLQANETVKLIFGATCFMFALCGLIAQFVAEYTIKRGAVPDSGPVGVLGSPAFNAWVDIAVRRREAWRVAGAKIQRISGVLLFASVVSGLTINFPYLKWWGLGLTSFVFLVLLVLVGRLVSQINKDRSEITNQIVATTQQFGLERRPGQ